MTPFSPARDYLASVRAHSLLSRCSSLIQRERLRMSWLPDFFFFFLFFFSATGSIYVCVSVVVVHRRHDNISPRDDVDSLYTYRMVYFSVALKISVTIFSETKHF